MHKNLLLARYMLEVLPPYTFDIDLYYSKQKSTNMFVITNFKNRDRYEKTFDTPFRKNCIRYYPVVKEILPPDSANSEEFNKINREYYQYAENVVRGEYIYAHRADHCGKFTYRFHWTDLKNPGPVILEGWQ